MHPEPVQQLRESVASVSADRFVARLYASLAWEATIAIGDAALGSRLVERVLRQAWEDRERFASSDALFLQSRDAARNAIRAEADRRRSVTQLDGSDERAAVPGSLAVMSPEAVLRRLAGNGDAVAVPSATRAIEFGALDDVRLVAATASLNSTAMYPTPAASAPGTAAHRPPPAAAMPVPAMPVPAMPVPAMPVPAMPVPAMPARRRRVPGAPRNGGGANGAYSPMHFAARIRDAAAPRLSPRVIAIGAVVLAIVLLVGWLILGRANAEEQALAALAGEFENASATQRGERASVTLADGSLARLGAAASLRASTAFGESERGLQLKGPVSVSLVSDPEHPVAISAGNHVWVTTGAVAAFDQSGDRSLVMVDSGSVELVLTDSRQRVTAGSAVRVGASGELTSLDDSERARSFSWRTGRLRLSNVNLAEVRGEILTWFDRDLKFGAGSTPDMVVSLDVPLDATDSLVTAMQRSTGASVTTSGRTIEISAARPEASAPTVNRARPRSTQRRPPLVVPDILPRIGPP